MLGKLGDIFSIAPILNHEFAVTKRKAVLIIASQFASVTDDMDYVERCVWDGHWTDLKGAIAFAKRRFSQVVPLATFGANFPIEKQTPSFQLDQWKRGDALSLWDSLPLPIRAQNGKPLKKPYILYADHSESCPFTPREELARLLVDEFPHHKIVRLSEIRVPRVTGFVPLYDAADALVTIDTMHLHLSRATKAPVIALAADKPSKWHGAAFHPRYRFYCRYGDYHRRKPELVDAIRGAVNNRRLPTVHTLKTAHEFGYNPSIVRHGDKLLTTYRWHPIKAWQTSLALNDGHMTHTIQMPAMGAARSFEDAKLFMFRDQLHISFVSAAAEYGKFKSIVCYGKLIEKDGWRVNQWFQPKYDHNDWSRIQKNWVFFECDNRLYALYGSAPEQIVIELDGDKVNAAHRSDGPSWDYGEIRGGCVIPWKGRLLRFFHSHGDSVDRNNWIYYIGATLMESTPPFKTIAVSGKPILAGDERWTPNCHHWKASVVFPGGAVQDGDTITLAFGRNDCECCLVNLNKHDLNL